MNIPARTNEIFETLSKGLFLCSNSPDEKARRLYSIVDNHFEELYIYFDHIGFSLERGHEYFYFSRQEKVVDLERKIEKALKWIDILDFLKEYDNSFSSGFRFTPSEIHVRLNVDAVLKSRLEGLKRYTKQENYESSIAEIVDMLCKEGFAEQESEITNTYKVLASFQYMEQLILSINIPDEVRQEIPE
jgi:hypothetical protein